MIGVTMWFALGGLVVAATESLPTPDARSVAVAETRHVKWEVDGRARSIALVDTADQVDYLDPNQVDAFCRATKGADTYTATGLVAEGDRWRVVFGDIDLEVVLRVETHPSHFILTVLSVSDPEVDELTIVDIALSLPGSLDDPFAACALAGNLLTRVHELPGPSKRLRATAYRRFGIVGATVAIVAAPTGELRESLQQAVAELPGLPRHRDPGIDPIGGPWALDAPINRGSYLFDFGTLTEETVDRWIELVRDLGFNQIDFHTGTSLRFGDYTPNPRLYPRGRDSLRAVIDRLHEAGIAAGLHTYAFFIAKDSPYVTPRPDPRLGKAARFTLAAPVDASDTAISVLETTADVSLVTGFFARNSVTLQIGDELVVFSGVTRSAPFMFTGCTRGAHGTQVSAHPAGTPVHQLKECFGLFTPDGDSTLLAEIAANTADVFNECGFDMIYLDALDGEDILGGWDVGWHYGGRFVYEIARRLNRPALFEMSTFHHHLWCVRARMGAWDHPLRAHKRFIDVHCAANQSGAGMMLPMNLGWWAAKTWQGGDAATYSQPTYPDDIEYLLCKAIGNDMGVSLMGISPDTIGVIPLYDRLLPLFRSYEDLRHSGRVSPAAKARLRVPGDEFTLVTDSAGSLQFVPFDYHRYTVESLEPWHAQWTVANRFAPQPARLRIEGLPAAAPYDAPEGVVMEDFRDLTAWTGTRTADGVAVRLEPEFTRGPGGETGGRFTAVSSRGGAAGSWGTVGRLFDPARSLAGRPALGLWVHGDGSGALLNLQYLSARHTGAGGLGDHYLRLDFEGWRYCALVDFEGERVADFVWPYGDHYSIYREHVDFGAVESFAIWCNDVPPGARVECRLGPVKALPLVELPVRTPAVTINGATVTFPVEIPCGGSLEFRGMDDCILYGPQGEERARVVPVGMPPLLQSGANTVSFTCRAEGDVVPRARVVVMAAGEPFTP